MDQSYCMHKPILVNGPIISLGGVCSSGERRVLGVDHLGAYPRVVVGYSVSTREFRWRVVDGEAAAGRKGARTQWPTNSTPLQHSSMSRHRLGGLSQSTNISFCEILIRNYNVIGSD